LHTADWHLGHELAGWARGAEQKRVLDEIADLAVRNKVDALIVAGDIFDHQNPSSAMYKMLYDFFDHLSRRAPELVSILIAGNHDSAGRLEAPGPLLKRANVVAIGSVRQANGQLDLDQHLIKVQRKGKACGYVLAIPYLRPADLPGQLQRNEAEGSSPLVAGVRQLYGEAIAAARAQIGEQPLVVTGHLHVKGASLSESSSERRIIIGGEHAVPADCFGPLAPSGKNGPKLRGADYIALGHLHRAQSFGRGDKAQDEPAKTAKAAAKTKQKPTEQTCVRYAGSPMPLSVTERTYNHGISLVNIGNSTLDVEHLELKRAVPFWRVPAKGRLALEEVEAALTALQLDPDTPQEERPFVQVALQIEGPQPGFRTHLDEICMKFPVREVAPDIEWPGKTDPQHKSVPTLRLDELSPIELFARAFEEHYGSAPKTSTLSRFEQLLDEAGS